MVVVTSPQPNELEQKKKRQTLERAKANHLSKQLQMRLQYAKLKVEHGWQRQNLNEVENLYFHHSIRVGQRPHYAVATVPYPGAAPDATVQSPKPSAVPDLPSPSSANDGPESVSPSEHVTNAEAQSQACPPPLPVALGSSATSAFDLSDPNILAHLAQLAQSQTSTSTTSTSQTVSDPTPHSLSASASTFPPHVHLPQPSPAYPPQAFIGTSSQSTSTSTPSQPPTTNTSSIPTTQAPPIAPTALTYDSFWSTHASSAGPTRALYRTHTGFTASATPAGNVAMLTPGGHAAVMTAEGVYVGGGNSRSG